ncbi:MAG: GreA/GreB family elongation factor [Deltaproteobacteria bacterium]|nr:GreA/GreB family elongation factor [Deltaproteobacteria bacterium]
MSRAFVKESEGSEWPVFPEPALPAGLPNHITRAGAAGLRGRLDALRARREAFEGDGGVETGQRTALTSEIRWLEKRVSTFVETSGPRNPEVVGFGTLVKLDGPRERTVRIVGVDEVDPSAGAISWCSPLARALHGARVGDVVEVVAPGGAEEWEVVEIAPI